MTATNLNTRSLITGTGTPVVLFIYNRPQLSRQVFEAIRAAKPSRLLIIADGPKHEADIELCRQARAIIEEVDWETELSTNFSEVNMGCVPRIISGLGWVFSQVDSAIILEDDCLPDVTFFRYCRELLEHYRHDEDVMHISGCNLLGQVDISSSCFFSSFALPSWGWATWRRAWKHFNPELDTWQKEKTNVHHHISQEYFAKWTDTFEYIRQHRVGWDIPWNVDIWAKRGLNVMPAQNLVKNIGFGQDATFTKNTSSRFRDLKSHSMQFPMVYPADKNTPLDRQLEAACIALLREMD